MFPMRSHFSMRGRPSFLQPTRCQTTPSRSSILSAISSLTALSDIASQRTYGRSGGRKLARSRDVTVIHGMACTGVLTNAEGTRVAALDLRTASNRRHKVSAGTIVLACGGLETPRLLLASRGSRSCGLGNERDLVGRFYMTHLVSSADNVGALRFAAADTARAFEFNKTSDGVYGRRMILLSPEARRRERLPNIVFRPSRPPMDDASQQDPVLSMLFLVRSLLIPPEYARSMAAKAGEPPCFAGVARTRPQYYFRHSWSDAFWC